jgi:hypothetical protein
MTTEMIRATKPVANDIEDIRKQSELILSKARSAAASPQKTYPNDHPFAIFKGNFTGTGYFDLAAFYKSKRIARTEEDAASLKISSPMINRKGAEVYKAPTPWAKNKMADSPQS